MITNIRLETSDVIRKRLNERRGKPGMITRKELHKEVEQWVYDIANGFLAPSNGAGGKEEEQKEEPTGFVSREALESAVAIAAVDYQTKAALWRIVDELRNPSKTATGRKNLYQHGSPL